MEHTPADSQLPQSIRQKLAVMPSSAPLPSTYPVLVPL